MNDRWRPVLLGLVLAVIPLGAAAGFGGAIPLLAGAVVVGLATVVGGAVPRRPAVADGRWVGAAAIEFAPSAIVPRSQPGRVARALGRVESRELFPGSIAFAAGIGFCLMIVISFGVIWSGDNDGQIPDLVEGMPLAMYPLAGMSTVAVHRARTRSRRDGVEELFSCCPTATGTRDAAHAVSSVVPALFAAVTSVSLLVAYLASSTHEWGSFDARQVIVMVGAVLIPVGGSFLGVVVARWAPWTVSPVVAVVVIGLVTGRLAEIGAGESDGVSQLSLINPSQFVDVRFTTPRWIAHFLWLVGLVTVTLLVTLWRSGRGLRFAGFSAAVLLGTALAGYAATRPISDGDARRIASLIVEPDDHQACERLRVSLCTYAGDGALVDNLRSHVDAVLAPVPSRVDLGGWTVRQGALVRVDELDDKVAALLPDDPAPPGTLPVAMTSEDGVRFWLALAASGIADEARTGEVVDVADQARGVLAIWLATRDLPVDDAIERMASLPPLTDHGQDWYPSRPWPDVCGAGPTPVVWSTSDLVAARALISGDEAAIASVVDAEWERWIDPATTTNELLLAVGAEPVDSSSGRTPVVSEC